MLLLPKWHTQLPVYDDVPIEDPTEEPTSRPSQSRPSISKPVVFVFIVCLVAIVEAILLLRTPTCNCLIEVNSEHKTPVPQFPYHDIVITEDSRFQGLTTVDEVESAWDGVIQPHEGFVQIAHPRLYNLPPNTKVVPGVQNAYLLSTYHQLHCLRNLQRMHTALMAANGTSVDIDKGHAQHCFDYLRQGLMCAGDVTLEPPDDDMSGLHGWGVMHVCRRWEDIGRWARENAAI